MARVIAQIAGATSRCIPGQDRCQRIFQEIRRFCPLDRRTRSKVDKTPVLNLFFGGFLTLTRALGTSNQPDRQQEPTTRPAGRGTWFHCNRAIGPHATFVPKPLKHRAVTPKTRQNSPQIAARTAPLAISVPPAHSPYTLHYVECHPSPLLPAPSRRTSDSRRPTYRHTKLTRLHQEQSLHPAASSHRCVPESSRWSPAGGLPSLMAVARLGTAPFGWADSQPRMNAA